MGTKALKTEWADGDVIYIKFNGIDTKFMTITYNGSTWVAQAYDNASTPQITTFEVSDFSGISDDDKKLGAIHYPVAVNASLDQNVRTPEIQVEGGGKYGTKEVGAWIVDYIKRA